jgi:DNA-binding transcriptional MerR regulator
MTHAKANTLRRLLASADVARILDRTPAAIRQYARDGKLRVAALTPRGQRLFSLDDVTAMKQRLEERDRS